MDGPEIKNIMKEMGISVNFMASRLKCTRQHLGAVLNGRSRLTENMHERIFSILKEWGESPITISITMKSSSWWFLKELIPDTIDIQETLIAYLSTISYYLNREETPLEELERMSKIDEFVTFPPPAMPISIVLKKKNNGAMQFIEIGELCPGKARNAPAVWELP